MKKGMRETKSKVSKMKMNNERSYSSRATSQTIQQGAR